MVQTLNGPRLAPKSGKARQLVVILHGYGANGDDLIEIGPPATAINVRP